jgi:FlaA1/EpsC-like NDP-sugar epimerase
MRRNSELAGTYRRTIVFGAGDMAKGLIDAMRRDPEPRFNPVALLDDDPAKASRKIRGLRVLGGTALVGEVAESLRATTVVAAIPGIDRLTREQIQRDLARHSLEFLYLPSLHHTLWGAGVDFPPPALWQVADGDLLGRAEFSVDRVAVGSYVTGRTVLVTGGGGSIGSQLCRELLTFDPQRLVIVDHDESSLHDLVTELTLTRTEVPIDVVVADIRDAPRVADVFAGHRPAIVFHAAALKHVDLLEAYPSEGIKTNVFGTLHVLEAAAATGVERVVNISTDKAADPVSTLGLTKLIAERLTAHFAHRADGLFCSVRFGNVLGSRGSVLPTFLEQIAAGGPVTVTHPDVTRYLMTIPEAVRLVLFGGSVADRGETLILDMGDPVRILDLAHELVRRSGRDVPIRFVGLRPGEKLTETLIAEDERSLIRRDGRIFHSTSAPLDPAALDDLNQATLRHMALEHGIGTGPLEPAGASGELRTGSRCA